MYKGGRLQEQGGETLERDGILYDCAFASVTLGMIELRSP